MRAVAAPDDKPHPRRGGSAEGRQRAAGRWSAHDSGNLWGEPRWRGGRGELISLVFVLTSCRVMVNVIEEGGGGLGARSKAIFGRTCFLWTRGTAAREALAHLDRTGIDAEPLLAKACLPRDQLLQDRGGVIQRRLQYRFLGFCCLRDQRLGLGLRLAVEMDLRVAGILSICRASAATVLEALDHLVRYAATTSEDIRPELSQQWR